MSLGLALVVSGTALLVVAVLVATGETAGHSIDRAVGGRTSARHDPEAVKPLTIGASAAALVLALSSWLVPSLAIGVATWTAVRGWQRRRRRGHGDVERTDALASWIENLRDVLVAGDQPIGAIASTVSACPPSIRGPVRRLSTALGHQSPEVAFRRFADDLDDPLGDLVAAGLLVAVQRGARTVDVLSALATQARAQADRRRVLDAERAPVQREVLLLSLIMGGLLLGVLVFGRANYLSAYDTGGGQLFLTAIIAGYGALLIRVQRLAVFPRPARFLTQDGRRDDEVRGPTRSAAEVGAS